jgi:DNA-binding HxlR family transcriptional regulator
MIMNLISHRDYLRVLLALREGEPLRFSQMQRALDLNPTQLNRALTFLRKGLLILPRTIPTEGRRVLVEYSLGKRGVAALESFDSFTTAVGERSAELGASEVQEIRSLYQHL